MSHTYSLLLYHIVFSTRERRPTITPSLEPDLHAYLGGIVREIGGRPLAVGGIADHVHLLVQLPPRIAPADAARVVKTNSSKWVHEERHEPGFRWQDGYAAFSVSESGRDRVTRYIQGQAEHHRKQTFQEELIELLERHQIEYDPRYLWD